MQALTRTAQLELLPKGPFKFKAPTLEEVLLSASKIGLPEIEAKKFWCYYESVGWVVGRNKRMKYWAMALAGWKIRYEEMNPRPNGYHKPQSDTRSIAEKELDKLFKSI